MSNPISKHLVPTLSLLLLAACSDPCRDYCEVFVERSQECGLGGPSDDASIDECGDQVSEVVTDDACESAQDEVETMSCDDFKALVCQQPDASTVYTCE